jgi:hypothetical protein
MGRKSGRKFRACDRWPAPNLEPGDVVLADGREALVTARVEAKPGPLAALLEVAVGVER